MSKPKTGNSVKHLSDAVELGGGPILGKQFFHHFDGIEFLPSFQVFFGKILIILSGTFSYMMPIAMIHSILKSQDVFCELQ